MKLDLKDFEQNDEKSLKHLKWKKDSKAWKMP